MRHVVMHVRRVREAEQGSWRCHVVTHSRGAPKQGSGMRHELAHTCRGRKAEQGSRRLHVLPHARRA